MATESKAIPKTLPSSLDGAVNNLLEECKGNTDAPAAELTGDARRDMYVRAGRLAWGYWERSQKNETEAGRRWLAVALEISDRYHDVKWLKSSNTIVNDAVAMVEAERREQGAK